MTSTQTKKQQYLAGLRSGLPVITGFFPVGIAYALLARQAGMSPVETVLMSATVLAGSSQIMAAGMILQGAGIAAIILATFVLNLRHLIMSTCVMRHFSGEPAGLRLLSSFGVVDESFAVFCMEPEENRTLFRFLGLISAVYLAWVSAAVVGGALGGHPPSDAAGQHGHRHLRPLHRHSPSQPPAKPAAGSAGPADGNLQLPVLQASSRQLGSHCRHPALRRPGHGLRGSPDGRPKGGIRRCTLKFF